MVIYVLVHSPPFDAHHTCLAFVSLRGRTPCIAHRCYMGFLQYEQYKTTLPTCLDYLYYPVPIQTIAEHCVRGFCILRNIFACLCSGSERPVSTVLWNVPWTVLVLVVLSATMKSRSRTFRRRGLGEMSYAEKIMQLACCHFQATWRGAMSKVQMPENRVSHQFCLISYSLHVSFCVQLCVQFTFAFVSLFRSRQQWQDGPCPR